MTHHSHPLYWQTATDGLYKMIWDGHSARITDCYTFRHDIGEGKYAAICDKMTMKKVRPAYILYPSPPSPHRPSPSHTHECTKYQDEKLNHFLSNELSQVMSEDFSVRGECNYYMAREDFKAMPLALAFQHHHPLYSQVNQR